jgi:hypothetical protein
VALQLSSPRFPRDFPSSSRGRSLVSLPRVPRDCEEGHRPGWLLAFEDPALHICIAVTCDCPAKMKGFYDDQSTPSDKTLSCIEQTHVF